MGTNAKRARVLATFRTVKSLRCGAAKVAFRLSFFWRTDLPSSVVDQVWRSPKLGTAKYTRHNLRFERLLATMIYD
jgi:hypothetical protein